MLIRETKYDDIEYLKTHSVSRGVFGKMPSRTEWSLTLEHEGKILCVGGVIMITNSCAWSFMDWTEEAKHHLVFVYRSIRDWLESLARNHGIKRMQAYTLVGFEEAERTIEHLQFTRESRMRNFVDDLPADMWVRYFDSEPFCGKPDKVE
jgi:hypothetical protein